MISDVKYLHVSVSYLGLFGKMSIQFLCPFLHGIICGVFLLLLLLSCKKLYILEIKPLSVESFETLFPHSIGCLFVLFFMVSLMCKTCKFD